MATPVQETIERVREIDVDKYKYGFTTDIESIRAPKGLSEDIVRFISAKKGRAGMAARMAARSLPPLAHSGGAEMGARPLSEDRLRGSLLLLGPEIDGGAESLAEVDPELLRTYEKLGIPLKEQAVLAGVKGAQVTGPRVAVDAVFDSVSVVTTFKEELARPA